MRLSLSASMMVPAAIFAMNGSTAAFARNYDCTKPGNADKASCKAGVSTTPLTTPPTAATVPAPVAIPNSNGYTAQCKDGSTWSGKIKLAACTGHKGVQSWTGAAAPAKPAPAAMKPATATPTAMAAAGGAGQVWVNTKSHVYHCQGSAYYGKTKAGQYMTESAALSAGSHADHGKACH